MIELHSFFLLNSHNDLLGKMRFILRCFTSLSANRWEGYLLLLEQSQNKIKLLEFLLKKPLRLLDMAIECNWYGWMDMSKICLVAGMASVITIICVMSYIWVVWLILHLTVKSLVLVDITFITWWTVLAIFSYSLQICEIKVAMLFLTLVSKIISTISWLMSKSL